MDRFWGESGFQYQLNGPLVQFVYPIWGVKVWRCVCHNRTLPGGSYELSRFR
jgi:hypothetical protein